MNRLRLSFVPVLSLSAILVGCASPQPHKVAFDEKAFTETARSGSGTVTGRAYCTYRGDEYPANQEYVDLLPVNAYTTESIQRGFLRGQKLQPDPRLEKYRRSATSDSNGNFTIRHVPPGQYYLGTVAAWEHHYESENADNTGTDKMVAEHKRPIFAKVSVHNGETVRVNRWNQEGPDIGPIFAHSE